MRAFAAVYDGFVVATTITLLCVRSIVVCMHVNIGALFLGALIAFSLLAWVLLRGAPARTVRRSSILVLIACAIVTLALYAWVFPQDLAAQPAMAMRMALRLDSTPPHVVGIAIPVLLVSGIIAIGKFTDRNLHD